ncbi:ribonuclease-III-like-domain-containing protein [Aspergillus falconensis]
MASLLPVRAVRTASCSACRSLISSAPAQLALPLSRRNYSTPAEQESVDYTNKPRWSYTPPRTKAPFSLHFDSKRPDFPVNSDPQVLDQFYIRFLGEGGDKVLSDEVKWLAVTHKSFDQGRRGFNDRLAFLGKRIVQLQASLALAQSAPNTYGQPAPDRYGRKPFEHPALNGLENLSINTKRLLTDKSKLAEVARQYDLEKVLRWSPRKPLNLETSGVEVVLAHTLYALIGALSLEKGNLVANKVARERILAPLGFQVTV